MPAPVSGRATSVVWVATAVAVVAIIVLWGYPGVLAGSPNCPTHAAVEGRAYCVDSVQLIAYAPCNGVSYCNGSAPNNFTFQGVWFYLYLQNSSAGPWIYGGVTEASGAQATVHLLGNPDGPQALNWSSPDQSVVILWNAPFSTVGLDGLLRANVTCAVILG